MVDSARTSLISNKFIVKLVCYKFVDHCLVAII